MKQLKWPLFILSILLFSQSMYGQKEGVKKEFGITVGINSGYFKDINFSPLNYRQSGPVFGLNYLRTKDNKTHFGIELTAGINSLNSKVTERFKSDYYIGNLRVEYLKRISTEDKKLNWHIGGQFLSSNHFVVYEGLNGFTFNFAHSLGIKGMATCQLSPNISIRSSLSLPLLAYVIRPPYNGFDKTTAENGEKPLKLLTREGDFKSLNKYMLLEWKNQFRYKASDRLDLAFNYNLTFQKVNEDTPLTQLQNQFSISTIFKF